MDAPSPPPVHGSTNPPSADNKHTQRRLATRAELLKAARQLIREGRFRAASTEEISAMAGVSRTAFYLHFTSKDHLLDVLQDDVSEWYRRQFRNLDAQTASTRAGLVGWFKAFLKSLASAHHAVALLSGRENGMEWFRGTQLRGEAVLILASQIPAMRLVKADGRICDERRIRLLLLIFQVEQLCQYLALSAPDEGDMPLEILADEFLRFMAD